MYLQGRGTTLVGMVFHERVMDYAVSTLRNADAIGALDLTLTDDEATQLAQHYTPREPTGY